MRGLGPSLNSAGVQGVLADPVLELHKPDGTVVTNDEWKSTQQAQIQATGIAPKNEHEAAIVATLAPGTYTAVLSGKAETSGVGLIEVYDLDPAADSRLANISTRGFVGIGDNAMIAGLIVGQESTSVVVRAIGPSLGEAGVDNVLLDPHLDIYNANGDLSWSNDDWKQQEYPFQLPELKKTGLAPKGDREAALQFGSNAPDNWTIVVRGKGGATGVALVEVYDLGR